jgi:hypothetical protein
MHRIKSNILDGEEIWLLEAHETLSDLEGKDDLVAYTIDEQRFIRGSSPEFVRLFHIAKKELKCTTEEVTDGKGTKRVKGYKQGRDTNRQRTSSQVRRPATTHFNTAEFVSRDKDAFEFFRDYRDFKKRSGGVED